MRHSAGPTVKSRHSAGPTVQIQTILKINSRDTEANESGFFHLMHDPVLKGANSNECSLHPKDESDVDLTNL
jgi:hypothetical protein